MNILHVIASVDPRGGGPIEGILRQEDWIPGPGRREIVSLDPPDAPFLEGFRLKVHPLGIGRFDPRTLSNRILRFGYTPKFAPWLRRHARDYDCIVVHGLWSYASVGAARVLPALGTPYFVFPHGMLDPWFRQGAPVKHAAKQIFWLLFEGPLLHGARAVLFTTEEERRLAQGQFWGYPYRGRVVGFGAGDVDGRRETQIAAFRAAVPSLKDRRYLIFLNRLHPKKGCDLLVQAFASIAARRPDLDLVMAGPDQVGWMAGLRRMAKDLAIADRVHWPGMLSGDAKWGALLGSEALVLPSHQENFGVVVAEALACARPVLISNKVNIWREVEACGAGLVENDDLAGAEALLDRFLAMPTSEHERMQRQARACFEEHFKASTATKAIFDTIAQALGASDRQAGPCRDGS